MQAAQWQQHKQWQDYQMSLVQYQQQLQQWTMQQGNTSWHHTAVEHQSLNTRQCCNTVAFWCE